MTPSIDSFSERDIAKAIDHSLLRPELDDAFVEAGCRLAAEYDVASVCVRPTDVLRARTILDGTDDVQADIAAVVDVAHAAGAIVKVIFEKAYLTDDEKVRACHLAEAAGADFVKTSTGFGPGGATHDDLRLMRANTSPHIQVKAAGGVRTLDALLEVMALGTTRIGATATKAIIDDFRARKAGSAPPGVAAGAAPEGGY